MNDEPYIIYESKTKPNMWVLVDKEHQIVCEFEQHHFNETSKFTLLDDEFFFSMYDAEELPRLVREMTDWAVKNYYELLMPVQDERQRIGNLVRDARKQAGLTLHALSELCGVSVQNITKIENGKYNASIDILSKILKPLGKRIAVEDC